MRHPLIKDRLFGIRYPYPQRGALTILVETLSEFCIITRTEDYMRKMCKIFVLCTTFSGFFCRLSQFNLQTSNIFHFTIKLQYGQRVYILVYVQCWKPSHVTIYLRVRSRITTSLSHLVPLFNSFNPCFLIQPPILTF